MLCHLYIAILQECWNANFHIPHPVSNHSFINQRTTGDKFLAPNPQCIPNRSLVQVILHIWEIVAKATIAFLSNIIVIDIPSYCHNRIENWGAHQVWCKSTDSPFGTTKFYGQFTSWIDFVDPIVIIFPNQTHLQRIIRVCFILNCWISKSITNGKSLQEIWNRVRWKMSF